MTNDDVTPMEIHIAEHLSEIPRVQSGPLKNSIWIDCRLENCHLSGVHIVEKHTQHDFLEKQRPHGEGYRAAA